MVTRVTRLSVLQTGKLLAVLYGFVSVILLPFFLIGLVVAPRQAAPMLIFIILYPIMGFIGGVIGAALYNLASWLVGGLEITLETGQG